MSHPDVITTPWDDPRNVETLTTMWNEGASAGEIANAMGQGITRNAVIGKVGRLKLKPHHRIPAVKVERPAQHGNKGQAKVQSIIHRQEGRQRAEESRQFATIAARQREPYREGSMPDMDDGVDVSHLIGFADRRIGKDCSWISGEALGGAMCCGKPVVAGSQWCSEHRARVYHKGAAR